MSSKFATPIAAVFYVLGLFYLVSSFITILYVVINRPYASSPLVKGLPLMATLSLPAFLLMLASSNADSYLPFSSMLYGHLRQ